MAANIEGHVYAGLAILLLSPKSILDYLIMHQMVHFRSPLLHSVPLFPRGSSIDYINVSPTLSS